MVRREHCQQMVGKNVVVAMKHVLLIAMVALAVGSSVSADVVGSNDYCATLREAFTEAVENEANAEGLRNQARHIFLQSLERDVRRPHGRCDRLLMSSDEDVGPNRPRFRHWYARNQGGVWH